MRQAFYVKSGASGDDWSFSACEDVGDDWSRELRIAMGVRGLLRTYHAEKVMRCTLEFSAAWLGAADVEALIELKGVGVDDLAVETKGELYCQCRFAACGWSDEVDRFRIHGDGG